MADIPVVPNVEGQPGRELARRVRPWDWNLVAVIRLLMHEPAARQPWSWLWRLVGRLLSGAILSLRHWLTRRRGGAEQSSLLRVLRDSA